MNYSKIDYADSINGEGLRITLWCQGCSHRCNGCHNSSLWNFNDGKRFTQNESNKIMLYVKSFEEYISGLTLLGGEPFDNHSELLILVKNFKFRFPDKDIWAWSGYTYEELMKHKEKAELLRLCNVLIDGKYVKDLKDLSLAFRGSSNQRVIDVQKSINNNSIILYRE